MNEQPRRPLGPQPWDVVRNKLDQSLPFANMRDTPYYRDCVWEQFSAGEYKRRYAFAARQDARAQARRRRGAGRAEPLELRRRHDLAHRPLGVARAVLLRAGAAGWRADHDLFDGRHARRSRAPARRGRGQGRAPQPQRPVRAGDGRAPARAEAGEGPHRPDGDRSAPRRLHAGQPVQHAAQGIAGRRARLHQATSCTTLW